VLPLNLYHLYLLLPLEPLVGNLEHLQNLEDLFLRSHIEPLVGNLVPL
jgi:hypothetical protein